MKQTKPGELANNWDHTQHMMVILSKHSSRREEWKNTKKQSKLKKNKRKMKQAIALASEF